jgi:hypothetical protein
MCGRFLNIAPVSCRRFLFRRCGGSDDIQTWTCDAAFVRVSGLDVNRRIYVSFRSDRQWRGKVFAVDKCNIDYPNIWVGDSDRENPKTDKRGEVVLSVDIKRDRYIKASPNYYADCRIKGDQNNGLDETMYSLEDICVHGIVSNNYCGKSHVAPTPGVLVIYVRPRTFLEKWRL